MKIKEAFKRVKSGKLSGKNINSLKKQGLLNKLCEDGLSLLDYAIMHGHENIQKMLREAGAISTHKPRSQTAAV